MSPCRSEVFMPPSAEQKPVNLQAGLSAEQPSVSQEAAGPSLTRPKQVISVLLSLNACIVPRASPVWCVI